MVDSHPKYTVALEKLRIARVNMVVALEVLSRLRPEDIPPAYVKFPLAREVDRLCDGLDAALKAADPLADLMQERR